MNLGTQHTEQGFLLLINREHPLTADCPAAELSTCGTERRPLFLQRTAAALLKELIARVDGDGQLLPYDGFRSYQQQQQLYQDCVRERGATYTARYVAPAGASEHQSGLAIDMALQQEHIDHIAPDFPDSGLSRRFRRLAPDYGFIERYPAGGEAITGIAAEPWHFRYVGLPHALIISREGLTLEQYLALLREHYLVGHDYAYEHAGVHYRVAYLPRGAELSPPPQPWLLSGDNCGGCVLTTWEFS